MPYSQNSGSYSSTTTRYSVYQICLCYSLKIHYILIWHVFSKLLYIYTCRDPGILEMDSVTRSISLRDSSANRHHRFIRHTHGIFPSSWSSALNFPNSWSHILLQSIYRSTRFVWSVIHPCEAFLDKCKLSGLSSLGTVSYPLTLSLRSLSQNHCFS